MEYTFKHALTQEVAYHSILAERRKKIHERSRQSAIETLFRAQLEEHLAELAYHYRRSSDAERAASPYLKRSADQGSAAFFHLSRRKRNIAMPYPPLLKELPHRLVSEIDLSWQSSLG